MKRPADQAKLLFLYLLRSSAAALATPQNGRSVAPAINGDHILLRLATRTDVPSIQRCNLATLPENYNSAFYTSHMRQWPDLCLVAEHVNAPSQQERGRFQYTNFPGMGSSKPEPKIVGYVLGKVEEKQVEPFAVPHQNSAPRDIREEFYHRYRQEHFQRQQQETELVGHVTSLAVLQTHRRCGLAGALMKQLHVHLQNRMANRVGLHVRKSNIAAARLYENDGYLVENIIPHYYQDGEDAYFMTKQLEPELANNGQRVAPWEEPGPFQLPRDVIIPPSGENAAVAPSPGEPQISITGTL